MSAMVVAVRDIVTPKGLTIARKGDGGRAVAGAVPHEEHNYGKVFVYFNDCGHGYWVDRRKLRFKAGARAKDYISGRPEKPTGLQLPNGPSITYHFGENLRRCRKARSISQIELSERMGVAQSAISYRERQPHCPNGEFINSAADALQIPAFMFFVPIMELGWFDKARLFLSQLSSSVCETHA